MDEFDYIEETGVDILNNTAIVSHDANYSETAFFIAQLLIFAAGIGSNVWLLWQILQRNLFSKWYSTRLIESDLKIWITFLPWILIFNNLFSIVFQITTHLQIYLTEFGCVFKELLVRFFPNMQMIALFYIVRTGLLIARGHKANSNRFQIGLELTIIFLILGVTLAFMSTLFRFYEQFCYLEQIAHVIDIGFWLFLILYIFFMSLSVICGKRFATNPHAKLIQLSCNIGFLYLCFWLPLYSLFFFGEIVSYYTHLRVPVPVYYIFIALSNAVSIVYPIMCLRKKLTLFSSNLRNEEWNSIDMGPYEAFPTNS